MSVRVKKRHGSGVFREYRGLERGADREREQRTM